MAVIPVDQCIDTAAWTADGDALEALGRGIAEVGGEVCDDEEVVFFCDAACLLIVLGDRGVFIAKVHLDDLLDVLIEFGESLLDLVALRPDAAVDEALLVIGEMHEASEVLAEADGINDGEGHLSRRRGGEESEDDVVDGVSDDGGIGVGGLDEERSLIRESEGEWQINDWAAGQGEPWVLGQSCVLLAEICLDVTEACGRGEFKRRLPLFCEVGGPVWIQCGRGLL